MFCHNCGATLKEGVHFCGQCGTAAAPMSPERPAPVPQPAMGGESSILNQKKGRGRPPLAVLILVGVLVVAALTAAIIPAALRAADPKLYLLDCAAKTLKTLSAEAKQAEKAVGIAAILDACSTGKMQQTFSLQFTELPAAVRDSSDPMFGAKLTLNAETDIPGRKAAFDYGVAFNSADSIHLRAFLTDNILSLNSPELTQEAFYGLDTEQLGQELNELSGGRGAYDPALRFNLFDLTQASAPGSHALEEATISTLASRSATLSPAMTVEKNGKQRTALNGAFESLEQYSITLPSSAVRSFLTDATTILLWDSTIQDYLSLVCAQRGYDVSALTQTLKAQLADTLSYLEGDVNLVISIRKGCVVKVLITYTLMGVSCSTDLQIGTSEGLLSALSLSFLGEADGDRVELLLSSAGNHSGKGGSYTDKTQFSILGDGRTLFAISSELALNAKQKTDNFTWVLIMDDGDSRSNQVTLGANGAIVVDRLGKKLEADFEQFYLDYNGDRAALTALYTAQPFKAFGFEAAQTQMLTALSQEERTNLVSDMENEIASMAQQLQER